MDSNAKATIIAAIIGGVCLCLASVVGLFSPITNRIVEQFFVTPTATALPTNTPTSTPRFTLTPTPPPTETPNPSVVFFVYNNYQYDQDLYADGQLRAAVDTGNYATFQIERGSHLLQNCPRGKNPQVNASDCTGRTYYVDSNPFFWELPGNVAPNGNANFVVSNTSKLDIDFFVDGVFSISVLHSNYQVIQVTPGSHLFQACPVGFNPTANPNNCGQPTRFDVEAAVQLFTVHD